ncbi:hypothetical protein B5G20_09950, partial [Collinsella sp. An7]|uniref:hypothetical protein n=1 Tax=Collinsella sp. An7 TaxID=1965651 RepID=UPI000B564339
MSYGTVWGICTAGTVAGPRTECAATKRFGPCGLERELTEGAKALAARLLEAREEAVDVIGGDAEFAQGPG